MEKIEFRTPFLILHEEVEFELPVPEAVLETRSLKTRVRIRKKNMRLGRMQAERLAFGFVFQIYLLQFLVHRRRELLRTGLSNLLVLKLVIEMNFVLIPIVSSA